MSELSSHGERREAARSRRWRIFLACLFFAGLLIGLVYGFVEDEASGSVPLWAALGVCLAYLCALAISCVYVLRKSDELEFLHNLWGLASAGAVYVVIYPCWYVLWRGGLVAEPVHEIIFGVVYITLTATYLWRKYR